MKRFVLDESALIAFLEDENGADKIEQLIIKSLTGSVSLLVPVSTWSSVCRRVWQKKGRVSGDAILLQLGHLPLSFVELDHAGAEKAADLSAHESGADVVTSFAAAAAFQHKATLVTANRATGGIQGQIKVHRIGIEESTR